MNDIKYDLKFAILFDYLIPSSQTVYEQVK